MDPTNPLTVVSNTLEARIVVIGDSIAQGVPHVPAGSTFPELLEKMVGHPVINLGVGGLTIAEMEMDFGSNVEKFLPYVIVIEGGINDIEYGRSAEDVIDDLKSISGLAHEMKIAIIMCTLLPSSLDVASEESRIDVNVWIRRLPDDYRILADIDIELRDSMQSERLAYKYDSGDGAHPNSEGMNRIANIIFSAINRRIVPRL